MNKAQIKDQLVRNFEDQLAQLEQGADTTRSYANDENLKSEGKYDTRATEAKYLADALAKKLEDLQLDLQMLEELSTSPSRQGVGVGSLVQLEHNQRKNWYYLSPVAGGTVLNLHGETVMVISIFSPLGSQLMDAQAGEDVTVETPKGEKIYSVISIE